ncbi:hypothetical protein PENANT_c003G01547 [Penicillium antarcticum]|uniref:Uncharacterized protein n=1 Tax=Penicillium antarcticum TaxID=416450 RepID=A0A1V6QI43_9EURO|nr:uncharacterized protein N7508_005945 [Penicillium antarcticum]KAJ5306930.1 hypothetical protein N7508_005945 [Penicillium antarcticum]OQD88909.1 hypothetical protein PENANT_c003G01547 [Penicillium antarcticum]
MAPTVPNYVAFNIPVLKGGSNWDEWHEKFLRVTYSINPLYWEIFAGKVGPPNNTDCNLKMHPRDDAVNDNSTMNSSLQQKLDHSLEIDVSDKEVGVQYDIGLEQWSRSLFEAREYLLFTLDRKPAMHIQGILNPREAYLELQRAYSTLHAQSPVHVWQKWLAIHYEGARESPKDFVNRFKKALQELKDQGIRVSLGVEIAQFQAAIMQDPECLHFVDTLHIDAQSFVETPSVYANFIQSQTQSQKSPV